MLNGKCLLVTGGTGSFGQEFIKTVLDRFPQISRLVIYSRDELKQFEMSQVVNSQRYPGVRIRYFIGDVRDRERLARALEGIDYVVHAAALKQVPVCEYNPFEAIQTNVIGAQNVIEASIAAGVKRVVALSTDKAAAPINLYGATKLCSDKLFVAANMSKGARDIKFAVVRYGNVAGSRGSVIPFFLEKRAQGVLPITDARMTRFSISLPEGVDLVLRALESMWGGEIYVPKIPSYRITDVAEAIAPECEVELVGIRPGEKLHEDLITETDALATVEYDDYYVIMPAVPVWDEDDYVAKTGGRRVAEDFSYSSDNNDEWLGVDEIRQLIREGIDPSFEV